MNTKRKVLFITETKLSTENITYFHEGVVVPFSLALESQFDLLSTSNNDKLGQTISVFKPEFILIDLGSSIKRNPLPSPDLINSFNIPVGVYSLLDAHYHSNVDIISYMNELSPEVIFSHDFLEGFFPKNLSDIAVFIPNCYNDNIFYDFQQKKEYLCGFYGAGFFNKTMYPWRERVARRVLPEFPSLVLPRPLGLRQHDMVGKRFAEVMNKTSFTFGCTSIKDIPVRKVFEIPATKSVLVTSKSQVLDKLGFKHKENCLMVDTDNVLQTLRFYMDNPDAYEELVENAFQWVKEHHSWRNRNHFSNWLECFLTKKTGQKVVQSDLLGAFKLADENVQAEPVYCSDLFGLLKQARQYWTKAQYIKAGNEYQKLQTCFPLVPEYVVGVIRSLIEQHAIPEAREELERYLKRMEIRESVTLDPVIVGYAQLLSLQVKIKQTIYNPSGSIMTIIPMPEGSIDAHLMAIKQYDLSDSI